MATRIPPRIIKGALPIQIVFHKFTAYECTLHEPATGKACSSKYAGLKATFNKLAKIEEPPINIKLLQRAGEKCTPCMPPFRFKSSNHAISKDNVVPLENKGWVSNRLTVDQHET